MMKKILLAFFVLISIVSSAQRLQKVNTYGYEYNRVAVDSLFALPADTFSVPAYYQSYPWVTRKGTTLYLWNTSAFVWEALTAGSSTDTTSLSNRINEKQNISDTNTVDATRYWVQQQRYADSLRRSGLAVQMQKGGVWTTQFNLPDSTGGGSSAYTASNGITLSGSDFKLGGTLTEQTTIDGQEPLTFSIHDIHGGQVIIDAGIVEINAVKNITGNSSKIRVGIDSINIFPPNGNLFVDSLNTVSSTTGRKLLVHDTATGKVERIDPATLVTTPTLQQVLASGSTLTSANTINMNGNSFHLTNGSKSFIEIDLTPNLELAEFGASNASTANFSKTLYALSNVDAQFVNRASTQFGEVKIDGDVNATTRHIVYTAAEHKFSNKTGFGMTTPNHPDSTVHIKGGLRIENGTQGAGKVLTSDANGGASWQTPSGGSGGVYVDSLYNNAGADSLIWQKNSNRYAIKYPSGGGGSGWGLSGNSITAGVDKIGTTNNTSFRFVTNGTQRGLIDSTGGFMIGNRTNTLYDNVHLNIVAARTYPIYIDDAFYVALHYLKNDGNAYHAGSMGIGIAPTSRLTLPAGGTAASTAPLKFTTQAAGLTTVEQGAMELIGNSLQFTQLAKRRGVVMSQNVRTTNLTCNNTTTETAAIVTAEHGANYLEVGKCEVIRVVGKLSQRSNANAFIKFRIKYAGVTVDSVSTPISTTIAAGSSFELISYITCRSTGATGTAQVNTILRIDGVTNSPDSNPLVTINTTTAQDFTITAVWGEANASDLMTVNQGHITCIEPSK